MEVGTAYDRHNITKILLKVALNTIIYTHFTLCKQELVARLKGEKLL
jgi:hypothetical protein